VIFFVDSKQMRLRYSILRQLVAVQTAIAELKIDLEEHEATYVGSNKELLANLIRCKIALEQWKEQELRTRLADADELTKKSREEQ
jgi:hypothetical protein